MKEGTKYIEDFYKKIMPPLQKEGVLFLEEEATSIFWGIKQFSAMLVVEGKFTMRLLFKGTQQEIENFIGEVEFCLMEEDILARDIDFKKFDGEVELGRFLMEKLVETKIKNIFQKEKLYFTERLIEDIRVEAEEFEWEFDYVKTKKSLYAQLPGKTISEKELSAYKKYIMDVEDHQGKKIILQGYQGRVLGGFRQKDIY